MEKTMSDSARLRLKKQRLTRGDKRTRPDEMMFGQIRGEESRTKKRRGEGFRARVRTRAYEDMSYACLLVVLPLLGGCDSDGVVSPQLRPQERTMVDITVTDLSVLVGHSQQAVATARYDDGNESDVSALVTWEIVGDPTIASVSVSGSLAGEIRGNTQLTASKDGYTSNTANVTVCDLADERVDIFDTGSGKLFTNSPSVAYTDSIGVGEIDGRYTEHGTHGPFGDFALFNWNNANLLCATYNTHKLGGRVNWRLATRAELKAELYDAHGAMFIARGWPTDSYYWSATPDGSYYHYVRLRNGFTFSGTQSRTLYASCVSEP